MNKPAAMLIAVLLTEVAFANTTSLPSFPLWTYLPVSLLAFTISLDVVAIGYIIGKLFPATGVSGWLNTEYWELAKTAMLIAGVYAIIVFISSVAMIFNGQTPSTDVVTNVNALLTASQNYFSYVEKSIGFSMDTMFYFSETAGGLRSITLDIQPFINVPPLPKEPFYFKWGFSESIYANQLLEQDVSTYESMINDAFTLLYIPMAMLTHILNVGMWYMIVLGLWILLPIGIVFRAFPFVRAIGGTLIGIALGIGIVLPATIVMFNIPISNAISFLTPQQVGYQSSSLITGIGEILVSFYSLYFIIGSIYYFLNLFWSYGAYMIVLLFIYILDFVIVYALADNIAKTFGGNFKLGLGGKLRLA